MTHKLMTLFGAASFIATAPAIGADVAEIAVDFSVPSEGLEVSKTIELVAGQDSAELEIAASNGSSYRLRVSMDDEASQAYAAIYHVKEALPGQAQSLLLDEHTLVLTSGEASQVETTKNWGVGDSATFYIGMTPDSSGFVDDGF